MKTKKLVTIINKPLLVIFLLFLIGCSAPASRSTDLFLQDLYQKGSKAYQESDYQQAQRQWQEGLTLADRAAEFNEWSARFVLGLARISESTGNHEQAIHLAEQGLKDTEDATDKTLETEAHIIVGQAYRGVGDYPNAKYHSDLARKLALQIGDLKLASDSIRTLGAIYKDDQEGIVLAEASYQEALSLAIKAEDKLLQSKALNNLGELSKRRGQYKAALDLYLQSLRLKEAINELAGQGNVLGNICQIYERLNAYDQALSYCNRALRIARKIHDRAREANHLNSIAGIFRDTGKYDEAISYNSQSLSIKQELRDRSGEAHTLNNIAEIFRLEGKYDLALDHFSKSLEIKKLLKDRSGESATRYNIGLIYSDLGRYNDALKYLDEALLIQTELNEPDLLWRIYTQLSYVHKQLGHPWPAIFFGKLAVNTIQSIRTSNQGQSKQLQQSYLKDKSRIYEQLANLLIDRGRLREAQEILGMLKEEEYFDFIRRRSGKDARPTTATFTEKESNYEKQYQELTAQLLESGQEYTELSQKSASKQILTIQEEQRRVELIGYLEKVRNTYRNFVKEIGQVFFQGNDNDFSKSLKLINQYQGFLRDIEGNTVLVHYLVNDEKLRIILTSKNLSIPPKLHEVSISRAELNQLIFSFNRKLLNRNSVAVEAKVLYDHLIKPMEEDLQLLKSTTLMIYPYQSLRYLPFAALYDGNQYLVEHYAIAIYNAAAQTQLSEKPKLKWRVAGFGVSESPDKDHFADLPFVEDEINGIVQEDGSGKKNLLKPAGILPGSRYLNRAFTPEKLMEALKEKDAYQVFHLATHFKFMPGLDSLQNSFLLAGDGTRITLENLLDGDYQMAGKQLITLSACETALDESNSGEKETADGEEVEGLGTLVQQKGADAVLATLWEVDDCSTELFMKQFYMQREKQKLTKAEAMRQAQLGFIKGDLTARNCLKGGVPENPSESSTNSSLDSEFTHPYYWAPFILMGNFQ